MTKTEFAEIVEWLHAQWPNAQTWGPATIDTTYHLLERVDPADVWSGVFHLHEQGLKWRPEPSEILKAVKDTAAERARYRPDQRALPTETEVISLTRYLELRGFTSFGEAVQAWRETHGLGLDGG